MILKFFSSVFNFEATLFKEIYSKLRPNSTINTFPLPSFALFKNSVKFFSYLSDLSVFHSLSLYKRTLGRTNPDSSHLHKGTSFGSISSYSFTLNSYS